MRPNSSSGELAGAVRTSPFPPSVRVGGSTGDRPPQDRAHDRGSAVLEDHIQVRVLDILELPHLAGPSAGRELFRHMDGRAVAPLHVDRNLLVAFFHIRTMADLVAHV